jgi:hypothetical protein
MGALHAAAFAEAVEDGQVGLRTAISWHLQSNHYPPVPLSMVDPCIAAIDLWNSGEDDLLVELPDGITWRGETSAPAWSVIEGHHLQSFLG